MEKIIKTIICDHHLRARQEEVEATFKHRIVIDRMVNDIELCSECEEQMVVEFSKWMGAVDKPQRRRNGKTHTSDEVFTCLECPEPRTFDNQRGFNIHVSHMHRKEEQPVIEPQAEETPRRGRRKKEMDVAFAS